MARTKQTARRTTGAPAPRAMPGSLPRGFKKSTPPKPLSHEGANGPQSHSADDTHPSEPGTIPQEPSQDYSGPPDSFCSSCRNGGFHVVCSVCPRVWCGECIELPEGDLGALRFTCPACHAERERNTVSTPYRGFSNTKGFTKILARVTQRDLFPRCDATPLAIILIHLEGMDISGLPPLVVYAGLRSYLLDNIVYLTIHFNLGTVGSERDYARRVNDLAKRFESGDLKRFKRFCVYILTHSDPDRGNLHIVPANGLSSSVESTLPLLIPPKLQAVLRAGESRKNILFLLCCGAIMSIPESRDMVKNFVNRGFFGWAMAFGQRNLQPAVLHSFLLDVALAWFIQVKATVAPLLKRHTHIGAHTDIYLLTPMGQITHYMWSHPFIQPFGEDLGYQCENCGRVRPWEVEFHPGNGKKLVSITVRCHYCREVEIPFFLGKKLRVHKGPSQQDEQGDWYSLQV